MKISNKLFQFCKDESNKKELPIIESLIINKILDKISSLILFFSHYDFLSEEEYYLLLILESDITKKLIYKNGIVTFIKYTILKDLKEIFFESDSLSENQKKFSEMELYFFQIYRTILLIIDDFWKCSKTSTKLNFNKIYEKGYKIYEISNLVQKGFSADFILDLLQKNKNQKNRNSKNNKDNIKINQTLNIIEEFNPYPNSDFISLIKKTIDEKNEIFKLQKDKENKNMNKRSINIDYNIDKYNNLLNDIIRLITEADMPLNEINDFRRQNIHFRTTINIDYSIISILESELKELNKYSNNVLLNEQEKMNKELLIKRRINYMLMKNLQALISISDSKIEICKFFKNNKVIEKCVGSISKIISDYKKINFNNNLVHKLIYENVVSIFSFFKFWNRYKHDFENEKILFLNIFEEILNYESENTNPEKRIVDENIIIILLLNIIQNFDDINIIIPYLEKDLLSKILSLKFNKANSYQKLYENNFKLKVILNECFKQFVLKIFSENKILQTLIESVILYAWSNLKCHDVIDEIYLEDFIYLCSDYAEKYGILFKNALIKIFDIVEIKEKERPSRSTNNKKGNIKNALRIKSIFEDKINELKNLNICVYKNKFNKGEKKNLKNIKDIFQRIKFNLTATNKLMMYSLLKHICHCSLKIEKILKRNKFTKINIKNYIIDLDTSLIALTSILHSFPSYLSILLFFFQKRKEQKINLINLLVNNIIPILIDINWNISNNSFENINYNNNKNDDNNNYLLTESEMGVIESLKNYNIIKALIHAMTYRRRNMNEDEIFLIKKCRKKMIFIINDSLKEINSKIIKDSNIIINGNFDKNKYMKLFKSNILILYAMTEFYNKSIIYSQYNPFEIAKIILSKRSNIIENITNILKNMKIYINNENNKIYHEIGIIYLQQLFEYIPISIKLKKNNLKLFNNQSKEKSKKDFSIDDENEENEEVEEELENRDEIEEMEEEEINNIHRESENNANNNTIENEGDMTVSISDSRGRNEEEEERDIQDDNTELENRSHNYGHNINERNENMSDINEENINLDMEDDNLNNSVEFFEPDNIYQFDNFSADNNRNIGDDQFDPYMEYDMVESDYIEEYDSFSENNDDYDRDNENIFRHFNFFPEDDYGFDDYLSINSSDEIGDCDYSFFYDDNILDNRDDIILFKGFIDKNDTNNSCYDLYYEESLSFMFSFYINRCDNYLINFYKPNFEIKCFNKRRVFGNFEKISNSFIYKYITSFIDINQNNTLYILFGSNESKINYYKKILHKMEYNFTCYVGDFATSKTNILKEVRNNILKEGDVIKLPRKVKKEKKYKEILMDWDIDKIIPKHNTYGYQFHSSEFLFYPFVHFGVNSINNNQEKENIAKSENINENINYFLDIDGNKKTEGNKLNNQEIKENNEKNIFGDVAVSEGEEKEKVENNNSDINFEKEKDKDNENLKYNENEQFIFELPIELREDILKTLDPSTIPNLSPELQSEYHRLMSNDGEKNTKNSFPSLFENNNLKNNINQNEQNDEVSEDDVVNLDVFLYKKIDLITDSYIEDDILFDFKYLNKSINKLVRTLDDDFIENLILYSIKNLLSNRCSSNKKKNYIDLNKYFQLIYKLNTNIQIRYKIYDLFFLLWIYAISPDKNISIKKDIFEKNIFLKSLKYIYLTNDLNDNIFIDYYEQFFSWIITNYPDEMEEYFKNSTFKENGAYLLLKDNVEISITKNASKIKKLLNIKYDKKRNVFQNLLNIFFKNKATSIQTIYNLKLFLNIFKEFPNICTNNNLSKGENIINNDINENIIEKLIDLFYDYRINIDNKRWESDNNPTSLLNELINNKNTYQIVYSKIIKKISILKNNVIEDITDTFFNQSKKNKKRIYNNPFPEIILINFIKFISNIYNNITKEKNPSQLIKKEERELKKELLLQFNNFIGNINEILFPCWEQLNKLMQEINIKSKDGEKKIESKYTIFFPFLRSFIILSSLYIHFNSKNSLNKSSQFIIEKNYQSGKKSPSRNDSLSFTNSVFIKYFYKFCEDNQKIIISE